MVYSAPMRDSTPTPPTPLASGLQSACAARRQRLRSQFGSLKIDALLVSNERDILYLSGFVGHDSLMMVTAADGPQGAVIISDSRYDEFLNPWRNEVEVVMGKRHRLPEAVAQLCQRRSIR